MVLTRKVICNSLTFVHVSALFYTLVLNIAFFRQAYLSLGMENIKDYLLLISFVFFIFCSINILFSIILIGTLRKLLLVGLLLISAIASYFSFFYNTYIDSDMIANVFETNVSEAEALITVKFIIWLVIFGVLPSLFIIFNVNFIHNYSWIKALSFRLINIFVSIVFIVVIYFTFLASYTLFIKSYKDTIKLITPTNYMYGLIRYIQEVYKTHQPFIHLAEDAKRQLRAKGQKKRLLVIVVGETSRAKNFSLNGYGRETNPLLKQQQGLINFEYATACGTSTAISVPCMFSAMEQDNYDSGDAAHQDNLLDILARVGIKVFWKENDGGCKGVCNRIPFVDISLIIPKEECPAGLCYDINLLKGLDSYINKQPDDSVIVLHTNGSHGPAYYLRYQKAQEKFTPACKLYQIDNCPVDQLINAYDNTIINVDYMLNATIELLKKHSNNYSIAMFYMSDHGESLGENGFYLHGAPYNIAPSEQTHIPMLFWLSDSFVQDKKVNKSCMANLAKYNKKVSHDNLFHTVLGAMDVSTKVYKAKLDILRICEQLR